MKKHINDQRSTMRRLLDACQLSQPAEQRLQQACHPDDAYCYHKRRFLPPYQQRLKMVRDVWLYLFIALFVFQASAPVVASICLFSTFLSFAFLDETPFPDEEEW